MPCLKSFNSFSDLSSVLCKGAKRGMGGSSGGMGGASGGMGGAHTRARAFMHTQTDMFLTTTQSVHLCLT